LGESPRRLLMAGIMDMFEGGIRSPAFALGTGLLQGAAPGGSFGGGMQRGLLNVQMMDENNRRAEAARLKLDEARAAITRRQNFIQSNPFGQAAQAATPGLPATAAGAPATPGIPGRAATGMFAENPEKARLMQGLLETYPEATAKGLLEQMMVPPAKATGDMQNYDYMTKVLGYSPADAAKYTFEAGSGTNIEMPEMPHIQGYSPEGQPIYGTVSQPMTTRTAGAAQKEQMKRVGTMADLEEMRSQYDKEFLTYGGQVKAFWNRVKDKATGDLSPEDKEYQQRYTGFRTQTMGALNSYIQSITGAAMSDGEAVRIKAAFPNMDMGPTEFESAISEIYKDIGRAMLRQELMGEEGLTGAQTLTDVTGLRSRLNQAYERKAHEYAALNNGDLNLGKRLAQQDLGGYLKYME